MFILVEAFRAKVERFHGPYLGPVNKYLIINILTCAFVSVHCCRPSAREATPPQGWHKAHDTKLAPNVGPMAGGRSTTSASSRSAGQQPTAKLYEK